MLRRCLRFSHVLPSQPCFKKCPLQCRQRCKTTPALRRILTFESPASIVAVVREIFESIPLDRFSDVEKQLLSFASPVLIRWDPKWTK